MGAVTGNSLTLLEAIGLFVDFVRCIVEIMSCRSETNRRSHYHINTSQIAQVVTRDRDQVISR